MNVTIYLTSTPKAIQIILASRIVLFGVSHDVHGPFLSP